MATQLEIDGIPAPKAELTTTPARLIELAIEKGSDVDQLAKLLDLQLRWEANEAKRKFDHALQAFRSNPPEINRTKKVTIATKSGDGMSYTHAELDKANKIITDALLAVGLSHHWKSGDIGGRTTVTLVLRGFGHTEEMGTLSGPPDTSGGKNNIQAIGSTTRYLQRYVLFASLGIVEEGMDDDGKTEGMPENSITDYCIAMQDTADFAELKPIFAECWSKAKTANDHNAQDRFRKVYEEKKRSFRK